MGLIERNVIKKPTIGMIMSDASGRKFRVEAVGVRWLHVEDVATGQKVSVRATDVFPSSL